MDNTNNGGVNFQLPPQNPIPQPTPQYSQQPPKQPKKIGVGRIIAFAIIFGLVAGIIFAGVQFGYSKLTTFLKGGTGVVSTVNLPESKGTNVSDASGQITAVDVSAVVDAVLPSVVSITKVSVTEYYNFFGQKSSESSKSAGSGFIVHQSETEILIATNNHVIDGAQTLTVGFVDGKAAEAVVKKTDVSNDMAVISVPIANLDDSTLQSIRISKLGDSTALKVGETAIAIGNALGYGQSVTTGVISAVDRTFTNDGVSYQVLQTDAAINPGNSGGALLNAKGEVIGINNSKIASSTVEGVGYAIPMANALNVIQAAISGEPVSTGGNSNSQDIASTGDKRLLGITGINIGAEEYARYNIPMGVYLKSVQSGSVAEKAGLEEADVIVGFNGTEVSTVEQLSELIQKVNDGDTVTIDFYKRGTRSYSKMTTTAQF